MRLFIAIDIDETIKKALGDLQKRIKKELDLEKSDLKWVNPDNMHLTLKFIGEVNDKDVKTICELTAFAAKRHTKFDLDIETIGFFGRKTPTVLWVGSGCGDNEIKALQSDLEKTLSQNFCPKEKRDYQSHLTMCRIKNSKAGVKLARICEQYKNIRIGTVSVEMIKVYQSQLTGKGPVYTVVADYKLQ